MLLHFLRADTVSGVGFGGSELALVYGAEHGPDLELALGRATGGWLRPAVGVEKIGWVLAHTYGKVDSSALRQSEVLNHWLRGGPNYFQQLKSLAAVVAHAKALRIRPDDIATITGWQRL